MAIDFPNSPNNGDSFTSNDKTWQYNGTSWVVIAGSVSIDAGSVTASKLADNAVTSAKISTGAVHQTHLTSGLSGITVTTTANRGTDVASPFTGQTIFLTDVKRMQVWDGSAWMFMTVGVPDAPTSLSATPLSTTSVSVAFTAGSQNGSIISNYKYALSTNGGSTYSEYAALDPADITSPITISGLIGATTYHIKLKAVADFGDSVDSSAVSVTTLTPPGAPTSLSATALSGTSVSIAFTAGATGGSAFTNMEYALSTNSGATYGAYAAFSPADYTTPVVISGLANNTQYTIKLRHVTTAGAGPDSSAVTITTPIDVEYLVVAGGGGGGNDHGGGGGAGGYRSSVSGETTGGGGSAESALLLAPATGYTVTVGAGGAGGLANRDATAQGASGANSVFSTITSTGGGYGAGQSNSGNGNGGGAGGSGGGAAGFGSQYLTFGTRTASPVQGNNGARGTNNSDAEWLDYHGGGGGGAGGAGITSAQSGNPRPSGGVGLSSSISGVSTFYAGGGGAANSYNSSTDNGYGGNGGGGAGSTNLLTGRPGTANTGGGGGAGCRYTADGGGGLSGTAGSGGSGVVILRYPSHLTITLGAGLTGSTATVSSNKVTTITAGSGNVSWA